MSIASGRKQQRIKLKWEEHVGRTQEIGRKTEQLAADYLQQQGLELITRNYSCKVGEIDLIMRDKEMLVFVEVRYRNTQQYGGGLESVTYFKQKKLQRAATFYLQQHKLWEKIPVRFDVIALASQADDITVQWIKNAIYS